MTVETETAETGTEKSVRESVVLDPIAVDRAEREINRFVESRSTFRAALNEEARCQKAEDLRRLKEMRQQNKALWIEHFRRLAASNLKAARDFRRRARRLEQGEV